MTDKELKEIANKYGFTIDLDDVYTGYSQIGKTQTFKIKDGDHVVGELTWTANFDDETIQIESNYADWMDKGGKASDMFSSKEVKFPDNNENFDNEYRAAFEDAIKYLADSDKNSVVDITPNYTIDEENEILDNLNNMNGNETDADLDDIYESVYNNTKGKLKESESTDDGDAYFDSLMEKSLDERDSIIYNANVKCNMNDSELYDRIKNGTETKDDVISFLLLCNDYSDMYKDINGFRPRNSETMCVNGYSGRPDIRAFRDLLNNGINPFMELINDFEAEKNIREYYMEDDFFNTNPSEDEIKKEYPEYSKYFVDDND